MSWQPFAEPDCVAQSEDLELLITPKEKNLGGFSVRRVLPAEHCPTIGPYVFFDHAGPASFAAGEGIDVRPHPHIGISTVTWLFEGEIVHRDSLGFEQPIRPGAVNLMTAGRGIVHSERASPEERAKESTLHGIQLWLGLPAEHQETPPAFTHYAPSDIPVSQGAEPSVKLIMGEAYGLRSPVKTFSPTLYAEVLFSDAGDLDMPDGYEERAVYVVEGGVTIGGCRVQDGQMAVIRPGAKASIRAGKRARVMLIGGQPLGAKPTVWWNFVSNSKERIEQAKRDWTEGRFDSVPGDDEFIPLPD